MRCSSWRGAWRLSKLLRPERAAMQIAPMQLGRHLERGLKSLYTLHGDEPLLQLEALDALRAAARAQGFTERTAHSVALARF